MASLEESDEEYLDDPIQLTAFPQATVPFPCHNKNRETVFELTDPDGDLYIEKKVSSKTRPYKRVSITLPVSFFEIPRNVQLLNSCKQLTITVVNCDTYPWYHRKSISSDTDEEVNFYTKQGSKEMKNKEMINGKMVEEGKKVKIRPVSSPYKNLKVDVPKDKLERRESPLSKSDNVKEDECLGATLITNRQIDYKKNQGLIGMKITQTPEISSKTTIIVKNNKSDKVPDQSNKIKAFGQPIRTEETNKYKKNIEEEKAMLCIYNKTLKKKEAAALPSSKTVVKNSSDENSKEFQNLVTGNKPSGNITKVVQNMITGLGGSEQINIKDTTINNADSNKKTTQIGTKAKSTEKLSITDQTNVQRVKEKVVDMQTIKVPKNNIIILGKSNNVATTKAEILNKTIHKNTTALSCTNADKQSHNREILCQRKLNNNDIKIAKSRDGVSQNNAQVIKTNPNNANEVNKWKFNDKDLPIFVKSKTVNNNDYSRHVEIPVPNPRNQGPEHLVITNEKDNRATTYSAKLKGLKLTVKRDKYKNDDVKIKKVLKEKKEIKRAKNSNKNATEILKKNLNDYQISTTDDHTVKNKSVKKTSKKRDTDAKKQISESMAYQKFISGDSEMNLAQPPFGNNLKLFSNKLNRSELNVISEKCTTLQTKSHDLNNIGIDKSNSVYGDAAASVGKGQSSAFYINKYEELMQSNSQENSDKASNQYSSASVNSNKPVNVYFNKNTSKLSTINAVEKISLHDNTDIKHGSNIGITYEQKTNIMKPNATALLKSNKPNSAESNNPNPDCYKPVNVYFNKNTSKLSTINAVEKRNLHGNTDNKHGSNISISDELKTNVMKPNATAVLKSNKPNSAQSNNPNPDCFFTSQPNIIMSDTSVSRQVAHQNQFHQTPHILSGKTCPRIIKISNKNPVIAYNANMVERNDRVGGNPSYSVNSVIQNNLAAGKQPSCIMNPSTKQNINHSSIPNYPIQDRPTQSLLTTKDVSKHETCDIQQNLTASNSQILSHNSTAEQISHSSLLANQNVRQLSCSEQSKRPILQVTSCLQRVGLQFKSSHEILPPTCDIAMTGSNVKTKTFHHQNMQNTICQPQQQINIPVHTNLRQSVKERLGKIQSNIRNLKLIVQEKPKPVMRQNINMGNPGQETLQNFVPSNYCYANQNISRYGQNFQQGVSDINRMPLQYYINYPTPPSYDGMINPNRMYDMQNYTSPIQQYNTNGVLYNPSIPPPPPPSQLPPPQCQVLRQNNQMAGPYQTHNNSAAPQSVAGTTIIGHDNSGPVRKININAELGKKSNDTTQKTSGQGKTIEDAVKSQSCGVNKNMSNNTKRKPGAMAFAQKHVEHKLNNIQQRHTQQTHEQGKIKDDVKNSNMLHDPNKDTPEPLSSEHSQVANNKQEMLEELTKITTIESSNINPVKDLKRPLPATDIGTKSNSPDVKKYKPGPLSKKLNKPGPLSKKHKFNSMPSPQRESIKAPVTQKGYSPPILPIPTYQKTLEILARSNAIDPRLSQSIYQGDSEHNTSLNTSKNANNLKEPVQKRCSFDEKLDKFAKKISLDEYKKRICRVEDNFNLNLDDVNINNIKMEIKIENSEQDLGYGSDSTTSKL